MLEKMDSIFSIFVAGRAEPAWEKPGLKASEKRENQIDLIPGEHYLLWKSSGNSKRRIYCGKKVRHQHIISGGRAPIEYQ